MKKRYGLILGCIGVWILLNVVYAVARDQLLLHGMQLRPWVGQTLFWVNWALIAIAFLMLLFVMLVGVTGSDSAGSGCLILFAMGFFLMTMGIIFLFSLFVSDDREEHVFSFEEKEYIRCDDPHFMGEVETLYYESKGLFAMSEKAALYYDQELGGYRYIVGEE